VRNFFQKNLLGGKSFFAYFYGSRKNKGEKISSFSQKNCTFDLDDLDRGHRPSGCQMPISALVYLPSFVIFRVELLKLSLGQTDVRTHAHTHAQTDGRTELSTLSTATTPWRWIIKSNLHHSLFFL
jgi:hypothetical protein